MNIYNDYRALDTEIGKMEVHLQFLQSVRQQLSADIEKLYQSGFKDKKFMELKNAVGRSSEDLESAAVYFRQCVEELRARASIIKEYHAVNL